MYILYTIGLNYGCVELCSTLCCEHHTLSSKLSETQFSQNFFPKKGRLKRLSGLEAAHIYFCTIQMGSAHKSSIFFCNPPFLETKICQNCVSDDP